MACEQWQAKLDTYLDGELPPEEMSAFDAHVRGCAQCGPEALARVQMKRAVHLAGKSFSPSPEFRERIRKTIAPRKTLSRVWGFAWAGVALLLLIAVGTAYVGMQRQRREQLYSEIADLHVATLASSTPVDVVSADRHTVKPWFQGKIPFTFNLPELQNTDFTLVGGRVTYLGQAPGAHLIYQVRKHEISVFIFQERLMGDLSSGSRKQSAFSTKTWTEDGLRYIIVGDAASEEIDRLSELLQKAAKS